MNTLLLSGLLVLPLAALAQPAPALRATQAPITYYVGPANAPLFERLADTLGRPARRLPAQGEAVVVGRAAPGWVVVRREGFLYALAVRALRDYDPADVAAPPTDPRTNRISYEGVVPVPGATQADLYARARAWLARTYPPGTVQVPPTASADELVLKGQRPAVVHVVRNGVVAATTAGVIRHTLALYCKDGRYKYVLTDLAHDATGLTAIHSGGGLEQDNASLFGYLGLGSHDTWADLKVQALRDARALLDSLQEALTLQPAKKARNPRDF